MTKSEKTQKVHCYKCKNKTIQLVEFRNQNMDVAPIYVTGQEEEFGWIVEKTQWLFTRCKGCEMANLKTTHFHIGPDGVEREVENNSSQAKDHRKIEPWVFALEKNYIDLLLEIYEAFNGGSHRLAMMGLRTIIDMFIVDNIGDIGSFQKKIKSLREKGFINNEQFEFIEASIDAGNAAAHRGYKPSEKSLILVLEIVEHLLRPIAVKKRVDILKNEIPKRKKT